MDTLNLNQGTEIIFKAEMVSVIRLKTSEAIACDGGPSIESYLDVVLWLLWRRLSIRPSCLTIS